MKLLIVAMFYILGGCCYVYYRKKVEKWYERSTTADFIIMGICWPLLLLVQWLVIGIHRIIVGKEDKK